MFIFVWTVIPFSQINIWQFLFSDTSINSIHFTNNEKLNVYFIKIVSAPRILLRKVLTVFLGPHLDLDCLKAYKLTKNNYFVTRFFVQFVVTVQTLYFLSHPSRSQISLFLYLFFLSLSLPSLSLSLSVRSLNCISETTFSDQRIGLVRFFPVLLRSFLDDCHRVRNSL